MISKLLQISIAILVCLSFSCTRPDSLPEKDLYAFINNEENELFKVRNENHFSIEVTYKPSDLVAIKELNQAKSLKERVAIRANYNKYLYFVVGFSFENKDIETAWAGTNQSEQVQQYLNGGISSRVQLIQGDEAIKLVDFMYSNMFGNTSSSRVLLVFKNKLKPSNEEIILKIDGSPLGMGNTAFEFESEKILTTPKLKL